MPKRDFSKPENSALKYDRDLYATGLSHLVFTEKEARAEYARLRRSANERIAALQRHGYGDVNSLRYFPKSFESARGASEKQVRKMLADVAHFMDLQTTSLRGIQRQRSAAIETLHEHGYDFINKSNFEAYGRFMQAVKNHYGSKKSFASEYYYEIFEARYEKDVSKMSKGEMMGVFETWLKIEEGEKPGYDPDDLA